MKPLAQERSPAAHSKDSRGHRIDAVVVSSDDALLIELGPILGSRYRTHSVDTPAEIVATVQAARWLGIVDVGTLPDARGAVARMELQYHRCPLIIVASNPEEWASAIARGAVSAAVARQELAGPRLMEALMAAEARLRAESVTEAASAAGSDDAPRSSRVVANKPIGWIIVAAALAGVLVVGGRWLSHRAGGGAATPVAAGAGGPALPAPAAAPIAAPAVPKPQTVLELLSAARVAFGNQKLLLPRPEGQPRGDSALELYTQVLKQQPSNDEALDGVRRLFSIGKARIQIDLASGKLDDATRLVDLFQAAGVSSNELQVIRASISAARPRWAATRAQQDIAAGNLAAADQLIGQLTASGASPASVADLRHALDARKLDLQLTGMANQVEAAIAAGALLDPAGDSARSRLAAMRAASRSSPVTVAAQRALQTALLARAQQAMRAGAFDQAQRYVNAAGDLGGSGEFAAAKRQLQAAMDAAKRRATVAAAAAARQLAAANAAATLAAAAQRRAAPAPSAAREPSPLPYVAARPRRALDVSYPVGTSVAGSVIVEFTLEPDGTSRDPKIIQSVPHGVFDRAALGAVRSGLFDTHDLAGRVPPVRARILLRFKPN